MTSESTTPAALRAVVTGRVQGVYYRVFVERMAIKLSLRGYVRNQRDLSVEVYAEGGKGLLEELLESLKAGPPGARVDDIQITWEAPRKKYKAFTIVP